MASPGGIGRPAANGRVGLTARVWRHAAARGVAVHPMSQVLQVPALREELRELLGLGDRKPQMLLRIGYAEPEGERRPRKPLEEVVVMG